MATNPFLWNAKGEKMSPKEVERQRALAAALQDKAVDTSPVGHWTQGAARLVNAFSGMRKDRQAGAAEKAGQSSAKAIIDALMGGGGNLSMSSMSAPAQPPAGVAPVADGGLGFSGQAPSAPMAQGGNKQAFIEAMMPHALAVSQQTGLDPRLVIAQAAQETGWGKSAPGNNYFGIKSHGKGGGNTLATNEVINGQTVRVNDSFRGYNDMGDSALGYASFLQENPRYRAMLSAPDLDSQVAALGQSGYATDPNYAASVGSIARSIPLPDGTVTASTQNAPYGGGYAPSGAAGGMSPVMQALLQASTDPWVAQEYGPVLQALMGQESKRQDFAMEQAALAADPLRQLQIQQAQQELGAPIEVGGVLLDRNSRQPIFDSRVPDTPDVPSSVREYEFYTQQEKEAGRTPLSYNQWDLQGKKAGGISVGGNNDIGTIPAGMMVTRDQLGNVTGMMPIPGGPAAVDAATTAQKQELARSNAMTATDVVTSAAARAREANGKRALGGAFGAVAANIPTTANAEVYRQVDVLKSNAKVENLNAMRAASPTGGALGSVTDSESAMLAAKSGALDPASPNFDRDLDDYERTLLRVVHGRDQGDALFEQTRGERTPNAGSGAVPAPADILAMTEQELMMLPVDQLDEAGLDAMEQRFQQLEAGQ